MRTQAKPMKKSTKYSFKKIQHNVLSRHTVQDKHSGRRKVGHTAQKPGFCSREHDHSFVLLLCSCVVASTITIASGGYVCIGGDNLDPEVGGSVINHLAAWGQVRDWRPPTYPNAYLDALSHEDPIYSM
jgi:hypothetical protein